MTFDFCADSQSPTLEYAEEQPKHSAMIAATRWRFENRAGLIDRQHRLLNRESALTSPRLSMFILRRPCPPEDTPACEVKLRSVSRSQVELGNERKSGT